MLSVAKNLACHTEILRYAQHDRSIPILVGNMHQALIIPGMKMCGCARVLRIRQGVVVHDDVVRKGDALLAEVSASSLVQYLPE